jgi:hypothetical protein
MISKKIIIAGIAIILITGMATAMFSGSHDLYKNETATQRFCSKCHTAANVSVSGSDHATAGCICHGYNPNGIDISKDINVAHNLTKQIYCTNCHSNYDNAGNITIHDDGSNTVSGLNQSAHYITKDNATLYRHAKQFFANSSG